MTALTQASIDEMKEIATRICSDYLTGAWKLITPNEIKIKRISGGLSNFLYHVSLPDCNFDNNGNSTDTTGTTMAKRVRKDSGSTIYEPKEILLRIYGQVHGENALETMLTESVVFTLLSERNLGPKLHGIFPGGRIEQYIPARALSTTELSDHKISMKIAEKMAEIHTLNIPVSKEPGWLWNSMNRWLTTIEALLKDVHESSDNNQKFTTQIKLIKQTNFRNELKWIKSIIENHDYPVVFCHNDLQEGNILLKEDSMIFTARSSDENLSNVLDDSGASEISDFSTLRETIENNVDNNGKISHFSVNGNPRKRSLLPDEHSFCELETTRDSLLSGNSDNLDSNNSTISEPDLIIIDYEYCAYNYRGFDLANHFLEWTLDYSNDQYPYFYHHPSQYPTEQQNIEFIENYLKQFNEISCPAGSAAEQEECAAEELDVEEIKDLQKEIKIFSIVSHLFWCLWSVVNIHQNIEFGYWDYAVCRLNEFKKAKLEYQKSLKNSP